MSVQFWCYDLSIMLTDCGDEFFTCGIESKCKPLSLKCDGVVQCYDRSDERNCRK